MSVCVHFVRGPFALMRGQHVPVGQLLDVTHLQMKMLLTRDQRRGAEHLALRVDFDRSGRSLLGQQGVTAGQPLEAEYLRAFAQERPDRLLVVIDFDHASWIAAERIGHVPVRQRLKDHRDAWRLMLPHKLASRVQFHQPVLGLPILEEHDAVLDGRFRRRAAG